jgi:hypothetical protein
VSLEKSGLFLVSLLTVSQSQRKIASITKIECQTYLDISLIYVEGGKVQISVMTDAGTVKYMQATVKDQIY